MRAGTAQLHKGYGDFSGLQRRGNDSTATVMWNAARFNVTVDPDAGQITR